MKIDFKQNAPRFALWALIAAALVALDQITKAVAVKNRPEHPRENFIPYLFNLVYTENRGAAWGMLADHRWIFITVSTVAVVLIAFALFVWAKEKPVFCVSLTLILAGGVGNMIDRIALGYVVDFIQFAFFTSFPIFNGADSFVTVGGVMMICYILFTKDNVFFRNDKKKKKENES